ncbi:cystathionine beta-lyase [Bacillus pakistanensis]|uniref:cysteine-S-conjugate beta-lyase n=1 Tax=Rossellomorea pakistanensis TaxID=992288 RepID=A0ABS2NJC9_9BACI|nr:MalY/PatB family protein [Bacillus pakistanensis]MBM7587972.1 cystathionine beta-lyase [Bacillus pakistanensis]
MKYNFDQQINRFGTYCTQWDYIEDRFGERNLLPFSISDTDFSCPPELLLTLNKRLQHGVFGYTRWNHSRYKTSIRHWFKNRFFSGIKDDWIVYSPSVIYSISKLIEILTEEGDQIVIQTPAYDAFFKLINDNKRVLSTNELIEENGAYSINFEDLELKLAHSKAKILLLCSPHNPTGRVWTREELIRIVLLANKYNVKIISDEIHMDIVLAPHSHVPIIDVADNIAEVYVCTSASKTFNIPGLIGSYMLIPNEKVRNQFLITLKNRDGLSSASTLGTLATMEAYEQCSDWVDELVRYIQGNFLLIQDYLEEHLPMLSFQIPQATYLAWIDVSNLPYTSEEIQDALVHHGKVAIMPGVTYGHSGQGFLRMNVGCSRSKVLEGLRRLKKTIQYLESTPK